MVGMLVRDEDGVHVLGALAAESFKAAQHFLAAETGVNQEGRTPRLEQRGIARAARSENGDAQ